MILLLLFIIAAVGVRAYFASIPSAPAVEPSDIPALYSNKQFHFFLKYPTDFIVNEQYRYTQLGPGKEIPGVSFTIPATLVEGTNLSDDSYISVEALAKTKCSAADFLDSYQTKKTVTDPLAATNGGYYGFNQTAALYAGTKGSGETSTVKGAPSIPTTTPGVTYEVLYSTGAGAGNFYEETVYLLSHCQAIRYFIHSSNIYNYDPGTIKEFDHDALIKTFDQVRRTYYYQK